MAVRRTAVALFVGLGALLALAAWQGFHIIAERLGQVGPRVLWLPLLHGLALLVTASCWAGLSLGPRPAFSRFLFARWVGFAANQLLPVARIGGEVARGRLILATGAPAPSTIAAVLADKTALVASIAVYAGFGIVSLAALHPGGTMLVTAAFGTIAIVGAVTGLYLAQRKLSVTTRWVGRFLSQGGDEAIQRTQRALDATYDRRARFLLAIAGHTLFRGLLTVEIWLALAWSGAPVTLAEALVIESLSQVLRAGAFMIPGALGAQEGSFVLLGALFGVPPPVAISASLCRRAREVMLGLPALAAWQLSEGRAAWTGPEKSEAPQS